MTSLMDEFLDSVVYDEPVTNWDIAETREDPDDDWVEKALREAIASVKHLPAKHDQADHAPKEHHDRITTALKYIPDGVLKDVKTIKVSRQMSNRLMGISSVGTIALSEDFVKQSDPLWVAAVIVHEAKHVSQMADPNNRRKTSRQRESEAIAAVTRFLLTVKTEPSQKQVLDDIMSANLGYGSSTSRRLKHLASQATFELGAQILLARQVAKSFKGHKGRPGQVGGSVPRLVHASPAVFGNVENIRKNGFKKGTYFLEARALDTQEHFKAAIMKLVDAGIRPDNKTRIAVFEVDKAALGKKFKIDPEYSDYPDELTDISLVSREPVPPSAIKGVKMFRLSPRFVSIMKDDGDWKAMRGDPQWLLNIMIEDKITLAVPVKKSDGQSMFTVVIESGEEEPEEKAGTVEGAKKAWLIRRRRQIEDLRSRAVATRDARLLARANAMAQSMARLQQASLVIMHLPTKHDQKEHGRLKAKGLPSIDNRTSMKDSDIRAALKQAGVTKSFVSRVTVVSRREMDVRMDVDAMFSGKPPRKSNTIGYFDVKTKEMVLTPHRNMAALVAHEMGHATAKAYPSMVKNFFSMITSGDTAHYREYSLMEKAVEKRGYPSRQYTSEAFAEFYAVVMSGRGAFGGVRSKFPYALKFFTEGG